MTEPKPPQDEIKDRYIKLRVVYSQLIGALYPSIVYNDLKQLEQQYIDAGGSAFDLPYTPQPNAFGYAPRFMV